MIDFHWQDCLASSSATIRAVMERLNTIPAQIVVIVDPDRKLLGVVTDGDIRRGLLDGRSLEDEASLVMNQTPVFTGAGKTKEDIIHIMQKNTLHQIPIVNSDGVVVGVEFIDNVIAPKLHDNMVFLMAGGMGKRLKGLTKNTPKPLLKVGEKPILELIINSFIQNGFRNFTISLGYKGDLIKKYFGDGSSLGCHINYTIETKPLGTAGALSLLEAKPSKPFFVMNGDILTKVNFQHLLDCHQNNGAMATMCVRNVDHVYPYGVIKTKGDHIFAIEEKPVSSFLVNSGIYVLDPQCLRHIPNDQYYDITSLFEDLIKDNQKAVPFPLHEYWIDIGGPEEFERATAEFHENF